MTYKHADECLACGSQELVPALKLAPTPLTDAYKNSQSESMGMERYPLEAQICGSCGHVQLNILVEPEESYTDYLYISNLTTGLSGSFKEYAHCLSSINNKAVVLDVGSNDGSFIAACTHQGHEAYGIEPSKDRANFANQNDRRTINGYFDEQTLNQLKTEFKADKFDIITFNNVLANIQSPHDALKLAKSALSDREAKIFIQTGYHPTQFSKGLFDYIYHEHYSYFSLGSMAKLAKRSGLKITQATKLDIRGGSIRVELSDNASSKGEIKEVATNERFISLSDFEGLTKLLETSKKHLAEILQEKANNGTKIYGYGASHSTGTLLHYFGLDRYIDELVDENVIKHMKFMPGTALEVKSPNIIYNQPNAECVVVVLAWQYFDQISNKLRNNGFKGKIIKPVLP